MQKTRNEVEVRQRKLLSPELILPCCLLRAKGEGGPMVWDFEGCSVFGRLRLH